MNDGMDFQNQLTRWEKYKSNYEDISDTLSNDKSNYRVFNHKVTRFNSSSWNELKDYLQYRQYILWNKYSKVIHFERLGTHKYLNNLINTMMGLFIENMIKLGYSINRLSKDDLKKLNIWVQNEVQNMKDNCLYLNSLYDIEFNIYQESIEFISMPLMK